MLDQKRLLDVWMTKWDTSSLHLVELMRLFSRDRVCVRVGVLCSLLCAEIILRLAALLTRLCLIAAVAYGLALGIV